MAGARTEVHEQDESNELQRVLLRRRQQHGEGRAVRVVYEAVRAARDGDGLQYELEEELVQRASADAADAISKVVPAPFRSCLLWGPLA